MQYGIRIETNKAGRIYQHKVSDLGVKTDREGEISNEIVEAQKKLMKNYMTNFLRVPED